MTFDRISVGGIAFRAPSAAELDAMLTSASTATPTYSPVGTTLEGDPRVGLHSATVVVGHGHADFAAARDALITWVPQQRIGADIVPDDQPVALGATVLLVLHRGPAWMVARNRVVAVVDEPNRFAYAYGTLPGHPERGEEAFVLDHLDDDTVRLTIRVAAGPSTIVGRALRPLVTWLSHAALRRYLTAVADHVASAKAVLR